MPRSHPPAASSWPSFSRKQRWSAWPPGRPDERPHPCIISLLREYAQEVYFTDAVDIPGLVEPVYHESVHLEVE